ncbi:hypothetical protein A2W13_00605 [Candidatus Woesebacteria bacterium RBG_16_36_11]|uniref:Type II secretion system protein GspG C-terminal domain-containing protein n=3 Tax=Candidatus Woeseibacteriota TaxID=1752722 RepID=A0A1F7X841_9BACT|nr:MAG: hypothetical protein A2Z67_01185 [Candidatus Woesebacteria bacterium RBG_13_36_22]OGM10929.1 MAG: hypothetical protein A2W13_00605 [Candidatus Woesebacteria bacterium RBG_16_36_11]OGM16899.1 MAG: hypothetical protein A2V55_03000 [Candidatus Woesebacteria bacterium RBG_19FT_COMBO_37_29]
MQIKHNKGFTLIELLVVIAIIGILVAASFFGIQGVFENARDTQRKSDLKQFQNALGVYASRNNSLYPGRPNGGSTIDLCSYLSLTVCPNDPNYDAAIGTPTYQYRTVDGTNGTPSASAYYLWSIIEATDSDDYWVICSNGKIGVFTGSMGSGCPLP